MADHDKRSAAMAYHEVHGLSRNEGTAPEAADAARVAFTLLSALTLPHI